MKPSDILLDFGKPVAYYPGLVKHLGSVNAVVFFCQIFFWTGKESDPDLGVFKQVKDITEETGLTYEEQRTARRALRSVGVLVETEKRLDHQLFYKINIVRLNEILSSIPEMGNPQSGDSAKPSSRTRKSPTRLLTESTSESTSENTKPSSAENRGSEPSNNDGKLFTLEPPEEKGPSLHFKIARFIQDSYEKKNRIPCEWGAAESKLLSDLLKRNPKITEATWMKCVVNRFNSDVNHADPVRKWIPSMVRYVNSAVDTYGNPKEVRPQPEAARSATEELISQGMSRNPRAKRGGE